MFNFNLLVFLSALVFVGSSPTKSKEDTRIVGGHAIEIEDAPYQVSLVNRGRHSCGGSIISEDFIITAAHCVIGSQPEIFKVRVGSTSSVDGGKLVDVEDIIWHNQFSYSKMDYDIAILQLKEKLEFSDKVGAIEVIEDNHEIDDGESTVVTGWGSVREGGSLPKILQSVEVPTVGNDDCSKAYFPYYNITPRMLCAGYPDGGKDACQGDSGGPLVHGNKLAGVVSWGVGCARPDYPGVYAKVAALRSWIDDNAAYLRAKKVLRGF